MCLDCKLRFVDLIGVVGDFYPTVAGCEISILNIQLNFVYGPQGLISRIEGPSGGGRGGVPELMAREFIRWKKFAQIPFYQAIQNQQAVDQLEQDIQELQKFLEILD